MMDEHFEFEFEPRFRVIVAAFGVTPRNAYVTLTDDRFVARFGRWTCESALSNVRDACVTGPYQWFKAIGVRGSFADSGLTFGSSTRGGVCVLFNVPVRGMDPLGVMRHAGLTVTVARREELLASIRKRAGLS
jgi:hypothetical protein